MPARSTLLQRVLFHLQRQLTANAAVQESAFLPDRLANGAKREVDVVIRSRVGEHEVFVSVECLDQKRRASVEWVEQMAEKHRSLPTSKLVLVSARGFSKTARTKAESLGIDAYSLEQAGEADWKGLVGKEGRSNVDLWVFRIRKCALVLTEDDARERAADPGVLVFREDGVCLGALNDLVRRNTERSAAFNEKMVGHVEKETEPFIGAELRFRTPMFVEDRAGTRHRLAKVRVYIEARKAPPFTLATTRYRNTPIAYGHGQSAVGDFTLTLVRPDDRLPTGAVSVENPETGKVQTVGIRFTPEQGRLAFLTEPVQKTNEEPKAQQPPPF